MKSIKGVAALMLAAVAMPAWAGSLLGIVVHGEMLVSGNGGINSFDPAVGFVPAIYGNASQGTNVVTVDPGIEFGYLDGLNTITADFTGNRLILADFSVGGAAAINYRFTALTPGAFGSIQLLSNDLSRLSWSLDGDVLTIEVGAINSSEIRQYQATFAIGPAAAPEPASWAMMLSGFGLIGGAMRTRRGALAAHLKTARA